MKKAEKITSLLLEAGIPAEMKKSLVEPWVCISCENIAVNEGLPLVLFLGSEDGIAAEVHAALMIEAWKEKEFA